MDDLLEDRLKPCAADGGGLEAAESQLTLLADFLQTHDFRRLRADQPDLAGGHSVTIELHRTTDGQATFRRI